MNKKGLIGKIFLIIGIIILIIGIIIGVTIYQGYKVYQAMAKEQAVIEESAKKLQSYIKSNDVEGMCTVITIIETSTGNMKREVKDACANPLIKIVVASVMSSRQIALPSGTISPNCDNIESTYNEALENMKPIKNICSNQTLINQIKQAQVNATNKTA